MSVRWSTFEDRRADLRGNELIENPDIIVEKTLKISLTIEPTNRMWGNNMFTYKADRVFYSLFNTHEY